MNIPPHLVNEHFDDRYFDVVNAIEEANHIYFKGCNIKGFFNENSTNKSSLTIGETGFGAGRLFSALLHFLDNCKHSNLLVTYNSVELFPISSERMAAILESFRPQIGPIIDHVVNAYKSIDASKLGWQTMRFERTCGIITVNLFIGEALDMVNSLKTPCDTWFLDGHGPKKNPLIWRRELLLAIGDKTRAGGTCATYTVAGDVRRALVDAGFTVEKVPGFGGKNSVLKGIKLGAIAP